jgi:hypothetical protein
MQIIHTQMGDVEKWKKNEKYKEIKKCKLYTKNGVGT